MFKDLFHKKRKYATIPSGSSQVNATESGERPRREIPEGLMNKCPKCGSIQYSKELDKNFKVCTSCGYHMRLNALERIRYTVDEDSFTEFDEDMESLDPLGFPGYATKLEQQKLKSSLREAVVTGQGLIGGYPAVLAVMSFDFFTGSMGSVVGEKITRAIEAATEKQLPLIIFSTSGGARMQESILSLMQMAKTSAALTQLSREKLPFVSVLTYPTMGGVSASFAMLGDLIIAEPNALIGFAGPRVIEQTVRETLPEGFQRSEFLLEHGAIDMIVDRRELRDKIAKIVSAMMREQAA